MKRRTQRGDQLSRAVGAGMVVGARIGIPVVTGGLIGWAMQPFFVSIGWLEAGDPFRKIMFLIALGTIMGAAKMHMFMMSVVGVRIAAMMKMTRME